MVQSEPKHSTPHFQWTSSPAFGVVHPSACHICFQYMTHVAAASHADDDPSFKTALRERDYQYNAHYLNGVCEGRRLQREHSLYHTAELELCRMQRDEALEAASQNLIDACTVRDELEKLKDEHRALLDLFGEIVEAGNSHNSREDTVTPSPIPDCYHIEHRPSYTSPHLRPRNTQLLTPESAVGSTLWQVDDSPLAAQNEDKVYGAQLTNLGLPLPSSASVESLASRDPVGIEDAHTIPLPVQSPGSTPSTEPETHGTVEGLKLLISGASKGDGGAAAILDALCACAYETPRKQRTVFQRFLLGHWNAVTTPEPVTRESEETGVASPPAEDPPQIHGSAAAREIFVDSAPSWGIGFIMNGRWLAWKLKKEWKADGRDNNWGEMVAVELGLRVAISAGSHSTSIIIRSDNAGVVQSLKTGISRNFQQNLILQKILHLCRTYRVQLVPLWVPTKCNPADKPSRGIFQSRSQLFPSPPPLPAHLVDFLEPSIE